MASKIARTLMWVAVVVLAVGWRGSVFSSTPGASTGPARKPAPLAYTGISIAGGEFFTPKRGVRPIANRNFVYPSAAEIDYYTSHGMNVIRVPFRWETLQPEQGKALDAKEVARLVDVTKLIKAKHGVALLDVHNYARYYGKVIGGSDVSADDFADFWGRLAPSFAADDGVWFGLMNEPHDMPADHWLAAANAAVAAIRKAKAGNEILVPGVAWTGAASWIKSGNADTMVKVVDPANRYAFEVHLYLDADGSGTKPMVVSPTIGSDRTGEVTAWAKAGHHKLFLGEFAVPATVEGHAALDDLLTTMDQSPDVWLGYTWWAAGPWWGKDYMFSIEPTADGKDRPQMTWLKSYLQVSPP